MRGGSFNTTSGCRRRLRIRRHSRALLIERHRIPLREVGSDEQDWDAARYQARHSYVFAYGESLIEMLAPQRRRADSRSRLRLRTIDCEDRRDAAPKSMGWTDPRK